MKSTSSMLVLTALSTALMTGSLRAQQATAPHLALTTTLGGTGVPDAIGSKCGRNGGGKSAALEGSAGVVLRAWRLLVLQADARAASAVGTGCDLVLFEVDTSYASSGGGWPLASSTIRIGVETPASQPLVRLTAGLGRMLGANGQNFAVIGGALGTRGRNHLLFEADFMHATIPATEVHESTTSRAITVRPNWMSFRLGMEWGLR